MSAFIITNKRLYVKQALETLMFIVVNYACVFFVYTYLHIAIYYKK